MNSLNLRDERQPLIAEPEGSISGNMDAKKRTNSARGSDDLLHSAMNKGGGSSAQSYLGLETCRVKPASFPRAK